MLGNYKVMSLKKKINNIFRYHKNCYSAFIAKRSINVVNKHIAMPLVVDPLEEVRRILREEPDRVWTSIELLDLYNTKGGIETNSTRHLNKILGSMTGQLNCFCLLVWLR